MLLLPPLKWFLRWYFNCVGRGAGMANLISKSRGGMVEEAIRVFMVRGGSGQEELGIIMRVKLATGNGP